MGTTVLPTSTAMAIAGVDTSILSVLSAAMLIVLLLVKEFVSARSTSRRRDPRLEFLSKALNAPIFALLAVFATIIVVRIWEVL